MKDTQAANTRLHYNSRKVRQNERVCHRGVKQGINMKEGRLQMSGSEDVSALHKNMAEID